MNSGSEIDIPVAAIGVPEGSLDALRRLARAIPSDSGLCHIVVQGAGSDDTALESWLCGDNLAVAVKIITDGLKPCPNTIYLMSSGLRLTIRDGLFLLDNAPDEENGGPIDRLFITLAKQAGSRAFCILLSGIGHQQTSHDSDGLEGLKAVKAAGGTTILQQDAEFVNGGELADAGTSKFVNFVLTPESIPAKLVNIVRQREISRQKELERNLAEREQRFRQALQTSRLGVFEVDLATRCVTSSERHDEILGHFEKLADFSLEKCLTHVHPDDRQFVIREMNMAMAGASPREIEYRICTPDNELRWVKANMELCHDEGGNAYKLIGTLEDITTRKTAEERQKLLMAELQHRVKNTLASILAIVRFTARNSQSIEEMSESLTRRLESISNTHNVLTDANWSTVSFRDILASEIAPYSQGEASRFVFDGTNVHLAPKDALALAMAVHELTTNSAKYGALAVQDGFIDIRVTFEQSSGECKITWKEKNGPDVKNPGTKSGFGSFLLEAALAQQIEGTTKLTFEPDGLLYEIRFSPKAIEAEFGIALHGV